MGVVGWVRVLLRLCGEGIVMEAPGAYAVLIMSVNWGCAVLRSVCGGFGINGLE